MEKKFISLRTGLYLISGSILLVGLCSAILIYRAASNDSDSEPGYEVIGGFIYPSQGENSKKYIHDLQVYGGSAAVLADEFMRWFSGLWHGKSLSYTVTVITLFLSFVSFVVANNVPRHRSDGSKEGNGKGTG